MATSHSIQFYRAFLLLALTCLSLSALGQSGTLLGKVVDMQGQALDFANVGVAGSSMGASTDLDGSFTFADMAPGTYKLMVSFLGYLPTKKSVTIRSHEVTEVKIVLEESTSTMDEVVVTGTLKEVTRLESPVPVEVYNPTFFKKNPTPNIYEALQNVNGVRPQLNCQVCNTGDIHINGLEGPYTMVLIDGMPMVSSLATVYGLSGIPNSLVERMEIVKGPASSLYGSEAIGGLINVITKNPKNAPLFSADIMQSTWNELNADIGLKLGLGKAASILTGINFFNYQNPIDKNGDHFTDVTIQERLSVFQKWSIKRSSNRLFTLAGRYYWEDRWGGEIDWTKAYRGSDEIYGEAITTKRWELLGQYQLPTTEKIMLSFSLNRHQQNSVYGDVPYVADQRIGFGQLTWDKGIRKHNLLLGTSLRYTYYDDNTPATELNESAERINNPDHIWLPGIFVQDEIKLNLKHTFLLGMRYDYNQAHGNIYTPRFAYKWSPSKTDIIRINAGTGFRIVNLFTEDHAALTGAREVVIAEELDPEQSYNVNTNYTKKIYLPNGGSGSVELSGWYTYFSNIILPDYETNSNQIIYDNLEGFSVTKGLSLNTDLTLPNGLSFLLGATLMDVTSEEDGVRERQILTERFTGTWSLSYRLPNNKLTLDYTGNIYGPMKLPLLGNLDPRAEQSPWWSIQNLQLTYKGLPKFEFYGGVKNILNWTPWKNTAHPIIARAFDPFDRDVQFESDGSVIPTPNNPHALTFDPTYVYAPNQGMRAFFGIRYTLRS